MKKLVLIIIWSLSFIFSACGSEPTTVSISNEPLTESTESVAENRDDISQMESYNTTLTDISTESETEGQEIAASLSMDNINDYIGFNVFETKDSFGDPTHVLSTTSKMYDDGLIIKEENNVAIEIQLSDGDTKTIHSIVDTLSMGEKANIEKLTATITRATGEIVLIPFNSLEEYEIKNEERRLVFKDGSETIEMIPKILANNPY